MASQGKSFEDDGVPLLLQPKKMHPCDLCGLQQTEEDFSESMWNHKAKTSQRTLCNRCCLPQCRNLDCNSKCDTLHWLQYPKTLEERDNWHCLDCRHPCDSCEEVLPKKSYSGSMWLHRLSATRSTLCNDCCRPPCTRLQCKTCTTCRNAGEGGAKVCRRRQCTEAIASLPSKQLPSTTEERKQWLCLQCRFVVCQVCKKGLTQSVQRSRKSSGAQTFKPCGDCQNLAESKRVRQKYT